MGKSVENEREKDIHYEREVSGCDPTAHSKTISIFQGACKLNPKL